MSYKKGGIGEITKAKIDALKKKILPTPTGYFIEVLKNEKKLGHFRLFSQNCLYFFLQILDQSESVSFLHMEMICR